MESLLRPDGPGSPHRAMTEQLTVLISGAPFPRFHKSHPLVQSQSSFRQGPVPWIHFFFLDCPSIQACIQSYPMIGLNYSRTSLAPSSSFPLIHGVQIHHDFYSWFINFHLTRKPFTSCVALGKLLNLSELCFHYL